MRAVCLLLAITLPACYSPEPLDISSFEQSVEPSPVAAPTPAQINGPNDNCSSIPKFRDDHECTSYQDVASTPLLVCQIDMENCCSGPGSHDECFWRCPLPADINTCGDSECIKACNDLLRQCCVAKGGDRDACQFFEWGTDIGGGGGTNGCGRDRMRRWCLGQATGSSEEYVRATYTPPWWCNSCSNCPSSCSWKCSDGSTPWQDAKGSYWCTNPGWAGPMNERCECEACAKEFPELKATLACSTRFSLAYIECELGQTPPKRGNNPGGDDPYCEVSGWGSSRVYCAPDAWGVNKWTMEPCPPGQECYTTCSTATGTTKCAPLCRPNAASCACAPSSCSAAQVGQRRCGSRTLESGQTVPVVEECEWDRFGCHNWIAVDECYRYSPAWQTGKCIGSPPSCCFPKSCSQLGANCGSVSDGCGGSIYCGSCTAPSTCGGGGKANVCGSAPSPSPSPSPR
jgi:hypothetical protein